MLGVWSPTPPEERTNIHSGAENGNRACPIGLSAEFGDDPSWQAHWRAFLKRFVFTAAPESPAEVIEELLPFFEPIFGTLE